MGAGCDRYGVFALSSENDGFEHLELADPWTSEKLAASVQSWAQAALG
jgi:hypothetical protein